MLKQGVLPFSYECEPSESGMTALAGLQAYLELATVARLPDSLQHHLEGCHLKEQGWTDAQIIMSLILLNIAVAFRHFPLSEEFCQSRLA
jgi:hypothetical protein